MSADRDMTICCLALWRMSFHMNYSWGLHNHDLFEDTEVTINNSSCMIHFYNMKQMDATLPWVCKVIDHLALSCVPLFCSYFILIYCWTDAKKHENLFVIYLLSKLCFKLYHNFLEILVSKLIQWIKEVLFDSIVQCFFYFS